MRQSFRVVHLLLLIVAFEHTRPACGTDVVFMVPADGADTEADAVVTPAYEAVTDAVAIANYQQWLDNGAARLALNLYDEAQKLAVARGTIEGDAPPYHIAIIPDGNFADIGFTLHTDDGIANHDSTPYIKLDPSPAAFAGTFLHETGHVVLATLAGGKRVPARPIASIPHSTAMLSNRGTAFNEGFAIHLETIAGHLMADEELIRRDYRFDRYDFASDRMRTCEYLRPLIDFRNYAQTHSRYGDVRRNTYAFAAAHKGPDYLRVQLDKNRDLVELRSANQLLQSEGFYATFFFACVMRGDQELDQGQMAARYRRLLYVIDEMIATVEQTPETPFLLYIVKTWLRLLPDEGAAIVGILHDLSHGVFVDSDAQSAWRAAYDAALTLDIQNFPPDGLNETRRGWTRSVLEDPDILFSRIGPQIACVVPGREVLLVAFGQAAPLAFDVNTVQEGVIRMIPDMTESDVQRWLAERAARPFEDSDDFSRRVGAARPWLRHCQFE